MTVYPMHSVLPCSLLWRLSLHIPPCKMDVRVLGRPLHGYFCFWTPLDSLLCLSSAPPWRERPRMYCQLLASTGCLPSSAASYRPFWPVFGSGGWSSAIVPVVDGLYMQQTPNHTNDMRNALLFQSGQGPQALWPSTWPLHHGVVTRSMRRVSIHLPVAPAGLLPHPYPKYPTQLTEHHMVMAHTDWVDHKKNYIYFGKHSRPPLSTSPIEAPDEMSLESELLSSERVWVSILYRTPPTPGKL